MGSEKLIVKIFAKKGCLRTNYIGRYSCHKRKGMRLREIVDWRAFTASAIWKRNFSLRIYRCFVLNDFNGL